MKRRPDSWYGPAKLEEIRRREMAGFVNDHILAMKDAGVTRVQWVASGLPDTCKTCQAANGRIILLSSLRRATHARCKCASGCLCVLIAVPDLRK
jgi:hypothetical protein